MTVYLTYCHYDVSSSHDQHRLQEGREPMRLRNRQEICTLIFEGVTNRIIIGEAENGEWEMFYLSADGAEIAHGEEGSREQIIEGIKTFLHGHAKQIFENLFEDAERYLGSMNLQPTTTTTTTNHNENQR